MWLLCLTILVMAMSQESCGATLNMEQGEQLVFFQLSGRLNYILIQATPFENAQRWMGKNTFPILLLNDDNMIGEH